MQDKIKEKLEYAQKQVRIAYAAPGGPTSTSYHFWLGQVDVLEALLGPEEEEAGAEALVEATKRL